MVSLIQGPNLTSVSCRKNCHDYPEHALGESNGRKPKRDGHVLHRHGVHPAKVLSGMDSELSNDERKLLYLAVNIVCAVKVQTTNVTRA